MRHSERKERSGGGDEARFDAFLITEAEDLAIRIPFGRVCMKGVREPNQILRLHANHAPTRAVNVSYQKE